MTVLVLDWETKSAADLKKVGLANYVADPTTDIWIATFCFDDEPVCVWYPEMPIPKRVARHVDSGGTVAAFNYGFEFAVANQIAYPRYGWPKLTYEQGRCLMAECLAMGLPGNLAGAAAALGVDPKDEAGKRVMLQLSKPREILPDGTIIWWSDSDRVKRLVDYGVQDTETERQVLKRVMPLSPAERAMWILDAKINQRGVQVDIPKIKQAISLVESESKRLHDEMRSVTGNFVGFTTETARLKEWVRTRGIDCDGVAKADVLELLSQPGLPDDVRAALLIRQEAGKSSTAKLDAMLERASADGRVRGTMQYHGAATGRWAGRGIQVHNFPRPAIEHEAVEDAIDHLDDRTYIDLFYGPVLGCISSTLRGYITAAPGHDLIAADFANIEGRVLAWLAGEEWKLQAFRDYDAGHGPDIYLIASSKIYHQPAEKFNKKSPEREVGKRCELAFGYEGGVGAWRKFEVYATADYVRFSDEKVNEIKNLWRVAHPATVAYWRALKEAAINAVLQGGIHKAGAKGREVLFKKDGSFLWCKLPSGRVLCYPYPQIEPKEMLWGGMKDCLTYMAVGLNKKWERCATYGGSLAENVTQAVARDILAEAITRLETRYVEYDFPVVMHVHDEVVVEVSEHAMKEALGYVERTMAELPAWAAGLPIAVEGWRGKRYRK